MYQCTWLSIAKHVKLSVIIKRGPEIQTAFLHIIMYSEMHCYDVTLRLSTASRWNMPHRTWNKDLSYAQTTVDQNGGGGHHLKSRFLTSQSGLTDLFWYSVTARRDAPEVKQTYPGQGFYFVQEMLPGRCLISNYLCFSNYFIWYMAITITFNILHSKKTFQYCNCSVDEKVQKVLTDRDQL